MTARKPFRLPRWPFLTHAMWCPVSRKRVWITNTHLLLLAAREPWLEQKPWKRLPPTSAGWIRRNTSPKRNPLPLRKPSKVREYKPSYASDVGVRVRDIASHPYNHRYLRLVERSYPSCTWHAERIRGDIGEAAHAYSVNGRLVALVMPLRRDK